MITYLISMVVNVTLTSYTGNDCYNVKYVVSQIKKNESNYFLINFIITFALH